MRAPRTESGWLAWQAATTEGALRRAGLAGVPTGFCPSGVAALAPLIGADGPTLWWLLRRIEPGLLAGVKAAAARRSAAEEHGNP